MYLHSMFRTLQKYFKLKLTKKCVLAAFGERIPDINVLKISIS